MDRQILLALQKAMKYIELHEDTGAFSKQTDGKMLYAELWMLVAEISRGDKSTDEAHPLSGGSVEAASEPRMSLHEAEQYADAFECAVLDYHMRNKHGALENLVKVQKKLVDALRLPSSPVGAGGGE